MKVIYSFNKIKKYRKPVVVLGVFDGVHLGHQRILQAAVRQARAVKGKTIVITFWPHPQKEESLYSLEHRLKLIAQAGIDICIVIKFTRAFARITAEDFIKDILAKKIGAKYIYVGKNYRFGKDALGNHSLLKKLSRIHGFGVNTFAVVRIKHRAISSTYIRRLIKKGNLAAAQKLLSRPVSILGTVIRGTSLARRLGFPTANIDPHHEVLPSSGVYAVKVILENKKFKGVCSIGTKPTFHTQHVQHIEVHIFNFRKNIYGKYMEIHFCKKIRNQKKFSSKPALTEQIKKDIRLSKTLFSLP